MSIDVAVAGGRNVMKKGAEKILKNKDPTIEVQRIWNVKIKVIAAVAAALEPPQNHSDSTLEP